MTDLTRFAWPRVSVLRARKMSAKDRIRSRIWYSDGVGFRLGLIDGAKHNPNLNLSVLKPNRSD